MHKEKKLKGDPAGTTELQSQCKKLGYKLPLFVLRCLLSGGLHVFLERCPL